MSTKKDDKPTMAEQMRTAEQYVKNPEDMASFTKDREKREQDAKDKAATAKADKAKADKEKADAAK